MARWGAVARVVSLLAGAVIGLGAVAVLTMAVPGSSADQPRTTATTPEMALAAAITAGGDQYAGPCEQTRSPEDIGKVCARFIDERNDVRAFLAGRTFSEFDRWIFVAPAPPGWSTIAVAPLDFHSLSPDIPWPS